MAYKKALEDKICSVFNLKKVVWGIPVGAKTQNCAWIIPEPVTESTVGDQRTFFVSGEIMIINPLGKMPLGRLYEKYQLARKKTPGTFVITTKIQEGFDHGDNQLTAQKFGFVFEFTEQYNPPKKMKGIQWIYNIIGKQNV